MENEFFTPESWGWKQDCYAAWSALLDENPDARALAPARVTGRERHDYELVCPDFRGRPLFESVPAMVGRFGGARVSGRFEYGAAGPADFPAPGDWVLVDGEAGTPRIQAVLPRRSALSRARAGTVADEQVLAANVDVIFLVFALDGGRNFLLRFLERALVVARNSGAACCVVLNKADLASAEERNRALDEARRAAPYANVVILSAKTGEGLDGLSAAISPGETGCMLGKSGVGKSALVNALAASAALGQSATFEINAACSENPTLGQDTPLAREGRVRADDLRGRHTTTSSRLYRLDSGILLIDSPGIRELKLWGDADGLEGGFPEIACLAVQCRFADCAHEGEPGCAVQEALSSGALDQSRYLAYLELVKEQAWIERRNDDRARRENDQKWKQISKLQKEIKKERR
jgi:ribosome biogenesis GTPase